MTRFPMFCAAIILLATPALSQGYADAIPNLARITCAFKAVPKADVPATSIEIRRSKQGNVFAWVEDGKPIVPVLAIYRDPSKESAGLTTVVSPDLGARMAMLTYLEGGEAQLAIHAIRSDAELYWSSQPGTCHETQGG